MSLNKSGLCPDTGKECFYWTNSQSIRQSIIQPNKQVFQLRLFLRSAMSNVTWDVVFHKKNKKALLFVALWLSAFRRSYWQIKQRKWGCLAVCFGTVWVSACERRLAGWSLTLGWKPADCTAKLAADSRPLFERSVPPTHWWSSNIQRQKCSNNTVRHTHTLCMHYT